MLYDIIAIFSGYCIPQSSSKYHHDDEDDDIGQCEVTEKVEECSSGFCARLNLPQAYFKFIIGRNGERKRSLELDTRTQIHIPKPRQTGDICKSFHMFS